MDVCVCARKSEKGDVCMYACMHACMHVGMSLIQVSGLLGLPKSPKAASKRLIKELEVRDELRSTPVPRKGLLREIKLEGLGQGLGCLWVWGLGVRCRA